MVNNVAYQPSLSSNNKKQAKTLAAKVALQTMGMLPRDDMPAASIPAPPAGVPAMAAMPAMVEPPRMDMHQFQQAHALRTVPDIDLSSFR